MKPSREPSFLARRGRTQSVSASKHFHTCPTAGAGRRAGSRLALAWFQVFLVVVVLVAGCTSRGGASVQPGSSNVGSAGSAGAASTGGSVAPRTVSYQRGGPQPGAGLQMKLGEGSEAAAAGPAVPVAPASPASASAVQGVLNRLQPLQPVPGDQQAFKVPASSLPAPRPGKTVTETFGAAPSGVEPSPSASGPLQVLRHSPDGPVPLAPYLSVTFNQPMVALTSVEDLAAGGVPVQLEPRVAGKWRWVGTQTLMFEPEGSAKTSTGDASTAAGRFPMSTYFTATVPAGTASANGSKLAQDVRFTFNTPPLTLQSSFPNGGPQRLGPILFASFDQRIDPAALLKAVQVKAGGKTFEVRRATADEIKADQAVTRSSQDATDGRWLAFKASQPFPADTDVTVTFPAGTPSGEGPRRTEQAQSFTFHTYGPFRITESRCGYDQTCRPLQPWFIQFTNPIDQDAFSEASVKISPDLPGAKISVYGAQLQIQGATQGRTTYKVTFRADLKDTFGQQLGADQTVTFNVGSADPMLAGPGKTFVVLDPSSQKPSFAIYSINVPRLKVTVQTATPDDWPAWLTYQQNYYQTNARPALPGKTAFSTTVNVESKADQLVETDIDLGPALSNGLGQLIVLVDPDPPLDQRRGRTSVFAWVQSTHIGLDALVDGEEMAAWANALSDGKPLSGVQLSLLNQAGARGGAPAAAATTGADGVVNLGLPQSGSANLLVARQGQDLAILPENEYYWAGGQGGWQRRGTQDELRWYVFDDRNLYKPGEEVHLKGWVRQIGGGKGGDVSLPSGSRGMSVTYTLNDARGNKLVEGRLALNALAGFTTVFTIPQGTNLGTAMLQMTLQGAGTPNGRDHALPIQVQEFRRPEYEVKASAGDGPFFVGGNALVTATATYYAGGGLPNAQVDWQVTSQPGNFTPPNWSDYTFGLWTPWWDYAGFGGPAGYTPPNVQTYTGYTDGNGVHRLNIDFQSIDTPRPMSVSAQATIVDVNRQAWTASADLLVHPADLYVGLRTQRMFVEKGQPLPVDAIVVDLDGNAVAGVQIKMRAARLDWKYQNGQYQQIEVAVQPCTVTSAKDPVRCTFETGEGGTYRIEATIQDDRGRANLTQLTRWVSGGGRPPSRNVEQEQVTLIPGAKDYQPGDTAEILVQAPFSPAEGLVTLQRGGIVLTQRFTMSGPSYTLKVPIVEGYIPNVIVRVDLVGSAQRLDAAGQPDPKLPPRPAFARGELDLSVPPLARKLAVTATPRDKALDPGGKTSIDLLVKDAAGQPVAGAEMAVVVVDEAVLALTNYKLPDPLDIIYSRRGSNTQDYHSRNDVVLSNPLSLAGQGTDTAKLTENAAGMAGGAAVPMAAAAPAATQAPGARSLADARGSGGAEQAPIQIRSDFNALAVFSATVPTDNQGRAVVPVKLPDNLTRYRVMAVAVADGKQFGMGESAITARLPLMVRPSAPRFLNFGDRFELPVVLQNQTDHPMTVTVAARAANALFIASSALRGPSAGYSLTVPANNRVEVRFPTTTDRPGTARFQFGATAVAAAGAAADAAEISLPVYTPATTEAFATYGVIDGGAVAQPVIMPTNVYTQFGGLQVSTSSTALQALTDAFLYLNSYPFECSEQLASRVLSVAALRDVLTAFQAPGLPPAEEIQAAVTRDVNRLVAMQNGDGGWPVWRRGDDSWPFYTIHVAHALVVAQQKGFDVPQAAIQQALPYLQNVESHIPSWYGVKARQSLIAYSLYVRSLAGDKDTAKARQLVTDSFRNVGQSGPENLSPEAVGWLLSVLTGDSGSSKELATLRQYLGNRVVETAGAANFVTDYGDDNYLLLGSDRRADAIILNALIADQPKSDLIPKLVNGLLAQRKAGRWGNTQENLFVLLALDKYFNAYEAQTPDFVARLWLGDTYAGDHTFRGRTTERSEIDVPMSYLATSGNAPQNLILSKDGTGRLYYRLGLSYAPTNLDLKPSDNGFTVERVYEWIDDPKDVTRDANGAWHIRAGARVRVRLTLVAPSRRYHVALVDPLPAGLEPLNPALATTGSLPGDQGPVPITAPSDVVAGSVAVPAPAAPRAGAVAASHLPGKPVWNWWRWWTWYEHQNLRDDRAEAFASLLWEGVYTYTYVARATTPGTFVVPPAKAEEMYAPETFGRSGTARVIVE